MKYGEGFTENKCLAVDGKWVQMEMLEYPKPRSSREQMLRQEMS